MVFPAPAAIPGGVLLGLGLSVFPEGAGLPGARVAFGALDLISRYVERDCKSLHQRIAGQHLRRTLQEALLPGDPSWREGAALDGRDRVVLDEAQEQRLTAWIQEHLLFGWAVCAAKDDVDALERRWIAEHRPVLNTDGTRPGSQLIGLKQVFREGLFRRV